MSLQDTLESKRQPSPKRAALGTLQTAVGVVREVRDGVDASRPVLVCGRPGPAANARAALLEGGGDEHLVQAFALRRLRVEDSERLAEAAVVIYAGEVVTSLDQETRDDLDVVAASERPVVVVLEGLDIPGEVLIDAARRRGITPEAVLGSRGGSFPAQRLRATVADLAGDEAAGLASRLPALRPLVIDRLIDKAAKQNGVVAAAVWIPGVDMPVLTALELRLVMQIAACYGHDLGPDRAVELAGVVGAGFGLRTIARELLDLVPVAGWMVKGAVAYSGTRAIGRAAQEYFDRGAVADLSNLRTRVEDLRG
jgi:uncharacterized protein (DUF697 family)